LGIGLAGRVIGPVVVVAILSAAAAQAHDNDRTEVRGIESRVLAD
jgi:hypothetical protein